MSDKVIPLVPPGRIRCVITGVLRKDTPEENVRQRWARSLVEEYGYRREDIALEFPIKMGTARKRADIVVFKEGAAQKQENIFIIVEAKREDILPRSQTEGVDQLKSYMAASASCRYGLWVGSERVVVERLSDAKPVEGIGDIPARGENEPKPPSFSDLAPAVDLKAIFRRCHNYVFANQGIQKAEAFHEFLKLIFCKVYDETESTGEVQFYIRSEERRSEAGQRRVLTERIEPLFEAVKVRYPYIFKEGEKIELNRRVLSYIVAELQRISLLRTKTDIKGAAYEELVGDNLRGDRGEYFTPRNVCDMAVRMVMNLFPPKKLPSLKVIDMCCGTGGFLVSYVNTLRKVITDGERAKFGAAHDVDASVSARIKEVCSQNVFGTDINPFLVRTCQMNLVMHGDGSANVFSTDSLLSPAEWQDKDAVERIPYGRADVAFTNPPFGSNVLIDDPHVLSKYELPSYGANAMRVSMPAERLFVEAALNFVKPGGFLAIVIPDAILNNPGLEFIRRWLVRRARVVASIDLPKATFAASGGVPNPSLLVLQKFTKEQIKLAEADGLGDYEVFMSVPKTAGIKKSKRAMPLYLRTPEGLEVLDEDMNPIRDDEISLVASEFSEWVANGSFRPI